ncbi:MAG TPA: hypothetical protein VFN10_16570 [Thermoanaerobaculia bacterium]|nr:hypothetical protein [Thermoanaerobaculia bacterium]
MQDEAAVRREFSKRLRAVKWGVGSVLGAFAVAAISMAVLPSPWPTLLGFAAMVLCLPLCVIFVRFRCPACGARPVDEEGDQTLAPLPKCRSCGVRLR